MFVMYQLLLASHFESMYRFFAVPSPTQEEQQQQLRQQQILAQQQQAKLVSHGR